jgi:UDP-GlcNAc:undecaprenyl-phosphate GlcNAc-1-phosphate transferase
MKFSILLISLNFPTWFLVAGGLLMAFFITWISIPSIVKFSYSRGLYDLPNGRTSHSKVTPYLGGVAVYAAMIISTLVMMGIGMNKDQGIFIAGLTILLFVGLKDDIASLGLVKKLAWQIFTAGILVVLGDIRIDNFYGLFGLEGIRILPSMLFTIFVIIVIINGIKLIDGIDGLATAICTLIAITVGIWFLLAGFIHEAMLSFSLAGSLIAFFYFNVFSRKNKIFLGDCGSLVIGLTVAVLMIRFIGYQVSVPGNLAIKSVPAVAFGILIIPLFDTLRVFILRISQGRSPFSADRQHLHHLLLDLGCSHLKATLLLVTINLSVILLSLALRHINPMDLVFLQLGLSAGMTFGAVLILNRRRKKVFQKYSLLEKPVKGFPSQA